MLLTFCVSGASESCDQNLAELRDAGQTLIAGSTQFSSEQTSSEVDIEAIPLAFSDPSAGAERLQERDLQRGLESRNGIEWVTFESCLEMSESVLSRLVRRDVGRSTE